MLDLKRCSIHVDQPTKKYLPGQQIHGHVQISFVAPTKMRALYITYIGTAHTSWSEEIEVKDSEGKTVKEKVKLTGHQRYFGDDVVVVGNKHNGEVTLPAGQYTYPISYTLPPNLPSSFDGMHGHIRFAIIFTLDRPWKLNKSALITLEVIPPSSIFTDVELKQPYTLKLEKTIGCYCWRSGPLSLNVTIPYTVLSPGQKLPVIIDCDNASNVNVNEIVLSFTKHMIFQAHHPIDKQYKSRVPLNKTSIGNVPARSSKNFCKELEVPLIEVLNLDGCRIIDLLYDLNVEGQVDGAHINLSGTINVKIANRQRKPEIGFNIPNSYPSIIQPAYNEDYTNVPLMTYAPQLYPPQLYPPQAYTPEPYKNENITTP